MSFSNAQKSFLVQSALVLALVVYGSHYWLNSEGTAATSPSREALLSQVGLCSAFRRRVS
jgi:hypothetical protein